MKPRKRTIGSATLYCGDSLAVLKTLPSNSVQCVVTSPPYFGLRDYGTAKWVGGQATCDHRESDRRNSRANGAFHGGDDTAQHHPYRSVCRKCGARRIDKQIGLEKTPEEFVAALVAVFREVRRVLRHDGTLWLNIGDSYASGKGTCFNPGGGTRSLNKNKKYAGVYPLDRGNKSTLAAAGLKSKDLIGIPWMLAFALRADGWCLRNEIIWAKPNPMPESVRDRCTKAHEQVFLLTKEPRYFFDQNAIKDPSVNPESYRGRRKRNDDAFCAAGAATFARTRVGFAKIPAGKKYPKRNPRTIWNIATQPSGVKHFAGFPEKLVERCLLAGTSERGCCAKCGQSWQRILKKTANGSRVDYNGKYGNADAQSAGRRMLSAIRAARMNGAPHDNPFPEKKTLGWKPTCDCHAACVPSIVLDPFAGSGTTLVVAQDMGLQSIGIDLSAEYVRIAADRIATRQRKAKSA